MLDALLFDLDGTLANTDPIHHQVWADLLRPYGYTVDQNFYQTHISGRLNPDIVRELIPQLYPDQEPEFSRQKEDAFRSAARDLQPMPGLRALLEWAQNQGLPMAVVTNAPRSNADFMLETLQLQRQFKVVVIADDLPRGKPDPLPYQTALQQLGVEPDRTLAFEDSTTGMRSAVAAGLTTVGIASTHPPQVLYDLGATLVVPDFTDPRLVDLQLPQLHG